MSEAPTFASPCTAKSLWHEYRIYADRLELDSLFGRWVIPFEGVERIEVSEPIISALLHSRFDLTHWPRQIKVDMADFKQHITLDKSTGSIRQLFFTPQDPAAFKTALEAAMARHHERQAGQPAG